MYRLTSFLDLVLGVLVGVFFSMVVVAVNAQEVFDPVEAPERPSVLPVEKPNLADLTRDMPESARLSFYISREALQADRTIEWIGRYRELKRECEKK